MTHLNMDEQQDLKRKKKKARNTFNDKGKNSEFLTAF